MKTLSKSCFEGVVAVTLLSAVVIPSRADSLWSPEFSQSQFADKRAHAVGDIVNIIVQESNAATKDNNTQTSKTTSQSANINSFLYSPAASGLLTKAGTLPALSTSSADTFNGGGKIANTQTINSRFSVRVIDVLPNDNLIVEGTRRTYFSGEEQTIVLRGTVRAFDVALDNSVFSYNLADVTIKFNSSGIVNNAQKKGWFSKTWDWINPF